MSVGTIHGVGLGPGAPDLISVRADRLVRAARHVAYFRKAGRAGRARRIVEGMLRPDAVEIAMEYPVTTEVPLGDPRYNACLSAFYADCVAQLRALAETGADVVVLCEGDPFFYGSFMYLFARLAERWPVAVVPGVSSLTACAAALGAPLAARNDTLAVLPAPLDDDALRARLEAADAAAIIKVGRHLPRIRALLAGMGLEASARYVEHATMAAQKILPLAEAASGTAPYFSMILVHRRVDAWTEIAR